MAALLPPVFEAPRLDALGSVPEVELLDALRRWTVCVRSAQAVVASYAAEIERRSARELGYDGLAQRAGARTPEILVSQLTGTSMRDARDLVTVGRVVDGAPPWLADVTTGVADGSLSVGVAAAIATGLGSPSTDVAADDLLDAARELVASAPGLSPDQVARRARELRDGLDADGVAARERDLRTQRSLRWSRTREGLTRMTAVLDPESAAFVVPALDAVTSPRRGGPRFVDPDEVTRAQTLLHDPRTTEQLALDAFVEMIRVASRADDGRMFGQRQPAVRVHVAERDLASRTGAAHVEGETAAVSAGTAERLACADGYQPIIVRTDGSVDVGRAQRLFTPRQRETLAATWGGCAIPGCDRPPSWCEAHHATPWSRGGRTDVANGILLCRHHHLLMHNNGWRIEPPTRAGGRWLLHPPPGHPATTQPIELAPKNPIAHRMLTTARGTPPPL